MSLINVGEFITLQRIGQGTNPVHKVKSIITDKVFAMKTVKRKEYDKHVSDIEELLCIMKCDHPNIIKIDGYNIRQTMKDCNSGEYVLCYLMKLMRKTLQNEIEDRRKTNSYFSYKEILQYLTELLGALEYLQRDVQIAHRDLKPENILLDDDSRLVLSDFNSSFIKSAFKTKAHTMVGSPFYLAPELRKVWDLRDSETVYLEYDPWRSDVYSLAVTFCDICQLDIARQEPLETKLSCIQALYGKPFSILLRKMLEPDMEKRMDFIELIKSPELRAVYLPENFPKIDPPINEQMPQKAEDSSHLADKLVEAFEKLEMDSENEDNILELISKTEALENEFKILKLMKEVGEEQAEPNGDLLDTS